MSVLLSPESSCSAQPLGGTVVAWGRNDYNQAAAPPGLTNVIAVSVGLSHSLALNSNGSVVGWGTDFDGEINIPADLTNVVAVAAGQQLSLALSADGTVRGLGDTSVPVGLTNVSAVAACAKYCLALKRDGTVVSWGLGWNGNSFLTINPPADLTNAVAIAAGQAHGVALRADGCVVAWGDNTYGQTNVPPGLTNAVALTAEQYKTVTLNADGTLTAWGQISPPPNQSNVVAIASGAFHDMDLIGNGSITGWGGNSFGVLDIPAGLTNAIAIFSGAWNNVALTRNNFYFATRLPNYATVYSGRPFYVQSAVADFPGSRYQWQFDGTNIPAATNRFLELKAVSLSAAGVYSVVVTNVYGLTTSSNLVLSVVASPPFITSHPAPQTVVPGTNTALLVIADGSLPISYQWRFNGTNLPAATNSLLSFTNISLANRGSYDVVLTNSYGTTTSSNVFLHVLDTADALDATNLTWTSAGDAAWFVQADVTHDGFAALQSGVLAAGQESSVQTTVMGPGTLSFWWNVSSAAENYLAFSVNGAQVAQISGVIIYGFYGWNQQTCYLGSGPQVLKWDYVKTSSNVSISGRDSGWLDQVNFAPGGTAPSILLSPSNQVVVLGSNATLNATVVGTPPLSFQWQFNGTNMDGLTNTSLNFTGAQFVNEGNYVLIISNAFGVTNTIAVYLNVVDVAESAGATNLVWSTAGDQPWFPDTTTTHDGVVALRSGAITANQQSTLQVNVDGPGTLSFYWKVSSETNNDIVCFSVDGTEQFRISGPVDWRQVIYSVASGSHTVTWTYSKNATVNSGSDAAWLDDVSYISGPTPPVITVNPTNQTAAFGQGATFQVACLGTPPLFYQWQFGGTNISDATNSLLILSPWSAEGNYSVIVSNALGTAVSSNAILTTLRTLIVPWGGNIFGPTNVPAGLGNVLVISAGGYNSMALKSDGTVVVWGDNSWGQRNVPASLSNAVAISCGSVSDCLAVRNDGTVVGWGLNGSGKATAPAGLTNVVAVAAGDNHSLALQKSGKVVAWGSNTSGQTNVPATLTNAIAVAAGSSHSLALRSDGTVVAWGTNTSGQISVPARLTNAIAIAACGNDSLALQSNGVVVAWGNNSSGQTNVPATVTNAIAIAAGTSHNLALLSDGTVIAWGNNSFGQTNVRAALAKVVGVAAGQNHSLALLNDGPLLFASQPTAQTNYAGFSVSFAANILGLHPIASQWRFNGTNISSATNGVLVLPNVQPTNSGNYSLLVSNSFGLAVSSEASLTVVAVPPTFAVQPTNQIGIVGSNLTLTVVAGPGPVPVSYQWAFNGTNIVWGTNALLTLTNVQPTDEGDYSVVLDNGFGSAVSSNAFLTVLPLDLPTALNATELIWTNVGSAAWFAEMNTSHDGIMAAQSGAVANGQSSTLRTLVNGPGTLTFWWMFTPASPFANSLSFSSSQGNNSASVSSTSGWQQKVFYLGAGTQTLSWTYSRFSLSGQSTGWVDQVRFVPGGTGPNIVSSPGTRFVRANANVTFVVNAVGTPPLLFQWQFNGTNLLNKTNAVLSLQNVQTTDSGSYSLLITNDFGGILTNATLVVERFAFNTYPTNLLLTPDGFRLHLDGVLTTNPVVVFASTDLVSWLPVFTNPPTTGSVEFLDVTATNLPIRFYRGQEQPF